MGDLSHLAKKQQRALDRLKTLKKFPVARIQDLGAMKLSAIARRGPRRDFWDLYEILRSTPSISLSQVGAAYQRRFKRSEADLYHVARALTFFDDAEADRVYPAGLTPRKWELIKSFFRARAPELLEAHLPRD